EVPPAENEATPGADAAAGEADMELFGDIKGLDINEAGTTAEEAQAYYESLDPALQEQVRERCTEFEPAVATQPADNAPGTGGAFCANLAEAGVLEDAAAQ